MKSKILVLPLMILAAVACRDRYEGQAGATSSPTPTASPYAVESPATPATTGNVAAVVVAVDASGRAITLREVTATPGGTGAAGREGQRYPVAQEVVLTELRPGDEVAVICEVAPGGTGAAGTLANCATVTMISKAGGATGR